MNTKLIVVIVRGANCNKLVHVMLDAGYGVTEFSSMGGFLRRKNTTLLVGVLAEQVEAALQMIREICPTPEDADEHSATLFVLNTTGSSTI